MLSPAAIERGPEYAHAVPFRLALIPPLPLLAPEIVMLFGISETASETARNLRKYHYFTGERRLRARAGIVRRSGPPQRVLALELEPHPRLRRAKPQAVVAVVAVPLPRSRFGRSRRRLWCVRRAHLLVRVPALPEIDVQQLPIHGCRIQGNAQVRRAAVARGCAHLPFQAWFFGVSLPELLTTSDSLAVPLFFMKSPFAAPCLWNSTSATSAWQCVAGAHRPDGCTPVTTQRHTRAVVAANEKSCGAAVPFAPSASAICLPQVDEPGAGPVWR